MNTTFAGRPSMDIITAPRCASSAFGAIPLICDMNDNDRQFLIELAQAANNSPGRLM